MNCRATRRPAGAECLTIVRGAGACKPHLRVLQTNNHDVLTLREAFNKIIHATEINYDSVIPDRSNNSDQEGHLSPAICLRVACEALDCGICEMEARRSFKHNSYADVSVTVTSALCQEETLAASRKAQVPVGVLRRVKSAAIECKVLG
jgi:hypothetical protein